MRLIDADEFDIICYTQPSEEFTKGVEFILKKIDNAPTIDAVEVVRCKDCEYYHSDIGWCDKLSYFQTQDGEPCSPAESLDWKVFGDNDYCSYGKRREENNV